MLYRHFDKDGTLLYIGISHDALKRAKSHLTGKSWGRDVTNFTVEHFPSREAALEAERCAIIAEKPLYNVVHSVLGKLAPQAQVIAPVEPKCVRLIDDILRDAEFAVIVEAMRQHRGNRTQAAARIGITAREMRYKLKRLNVTPEYWLS